jgi:hypothetical protein
MTCKSALVSLGCGILACVSGLGLPLYSSYGPSPAGTAGMGFGLALGWIGSLSLAFGLAGVICGVIALRRIRRSQCRGRGMAWTGIVLGCVPWLVLAGYLTSVLWEEFGIRLGGQPEKPGSP